MALLQWEGGTEVMHEGRLDGVSAASNLQERERRPHAYCRLSLVIDLKGSLDGK